jgi:cysteine desulfurase
MTERLYLDHNATSPLRPSALAAMSALLAEPGNASSIHREGQAARVHIEKARAQVAKLVGADPRAVVFTSGATEADNLALSPVVEIAGKTVQYDVLLISSIEHPAVRAGGRFAQDTIEEIPVDANGVVDLDALDLMLARHKGAGRRPFVSVMAANNETGVMQPLNNVAARVRAVDGIFHVDAVQVPGRVPFDLVASGADLISMTAHKFGGPQGIGALIAKNDTIRILPAHRGGGQEHGARAGTENVAAIVGFGAATEEVTRTISEEANRLAALRERLENGMRAVNPSMIVFSEAALRVPNTTCYAVPGITAETALIAFDLDGIAVSSGSACSSGKVAASHVLAAMKVTPEIARCAIRVSTGWNTKEADIARFLESFARLCAKQNEGKRTIAA